MNSYLGTHTGYDGLPHGYRSLFPRAGRGSSSSWVLVGDGPVTRDYSALIDSFDVVVRCNMFSKTHVGSKTALVG